MNFTWRLPVSGEIGERDPGYENQDHRRIDDRLEETPLHPFEGFRCVGALRSARVVDEHPWQIEHSRHPRDDAHNVQSLEPEDHGESQRLRSRLIGRSDIRRIRRLVPGAQAGRARAAKNHQIRL